MADKGIALTILGIVAVIAIVGLVLLFTGANTAEVIIGKPGTVQTWGKAVRTVSADRTCFLSTGALGKVKTSLELSQAVIPVSACEPYEQVIASYPQYCCPAGVV